MAENKDKKISEPNTFISDPIHLDINSLENEFYRADVEIINVDHSGPSYQGRIFLNNKNANRNTDLTLENGYVGAYDIFGHGGCMGNPGHCDYVPTKRSYDKRPIIDIKPQYKRVIITEALKKIGKTTKEFTITIVPVLYGESITNTTDFNRNIVKFEKIGIITYD